jgi:hypothetical protein
VIPTCLLSRSRCYLPRVYDNLCLEDENDGGEDDEEHEEVYAEDYDDTYHCTQRKQASLSHMKCYTQWYLHTYLDHLTHTLVGTDP